MGIILRDYQDTDYKAIQNALVVTSSVLLSAPCGYGKSVLIAHLANTLKNRVLVLTHREELLIQNSQLMEDYAVLNAKAKKKEPLREAKTVVGMAQTIIRRLEKYGADYAGEFDTIIIDEAHLDYFAKIYKLIPYKNRIGLTATPVIEKKETKERGGVDYTRKLTLGDEYDFLIQGISEEDLIEKGYLVKDFNIQLTPPNLDELKNSNSNPDGYTSESLNQVFGNNASIDTLFEAYDKYGKGKKTIIFNPTTKTNLATYKFFVDKIGEEKVRLFDSVNDTSHSRKETVEWFKTVEDAVLLNVGVFSVGFDVPALEVILFNKKTKSLGLYLQIAGRGSRPYPEKTKFTFVDMGLNIQEHGRWSEKRDWKKFFEPNDWKRKRDVDLLRVWECDNCGHYNVSGTKYSEELDCIICENCNTPKPKSKEKQKHINGKFVVLEEPFLPTATKLSAHAKRVGGDGNMVFRMATESIVDLFRYHTDKEHFDRNKSNYARRVAEIFRPIYFTVLRDDELTGKRRRLETELSKVWRKVKELYK